LTYFTLCPGCSAKNVDQKYAGNENPTDEEVQGSFLPAYFATLFANGLVDFFSAPPLFPEHIQSILSGESDFDRKEAEFKLMAL
jgi:hypothetical protein